MKKPKITKIRNIEVDSSGEEEPLHMQFLRDDDDEVNVGLNQAENP